MRDLKPPFRFDLSSVLARLTHLAISADDGLKNLQSPRVDSVTIKLPFVNVAVKPDDIERQVARELVIRLADRRVLISVECCDGCIREALASLQEIRGLLVDKQVQLAEKTDQPLYLLLELMAEAIRQFATFEQRLSLLHHHERHERQERYFAALEMLRAHLNHVLHQVAIIADLEVPRVAGRIAYDQAWRLDSYVQPPVLAP